MPALAQPQLCVSVTTLKHSLPACQRPGALRLLPGSCLPPKGPLQGEAVFRPSLPSGTQRCA